MEYLKANNNNNATVANQFMEDLFESYFVDAKNINDPTVLLDVLTKNKDKYNSSIGGGGSLDVEEIKNLMLESEEDDKIEYEIANLDRGIKTKYGVRGVPFFIIHPSTNKHNSSGSSGSEDKNKDTRPVIAFSGAYPVEIIAEQLEIAAGTGGSGR